VVSQTSIQPALATPALAPAPGGLPPGEERGATRGSVTVIADEANRMLLITATHDEYQRMIGILDRIDTLPDQVLLEATIAEVTLNDELQLGLRWFFEKGKSQFKLTDSVIGAIAPTFPGFSYFFNSVNVQVALNALSNVTDVNIRKPSIAMGCWMSKGTNSRAVTRMMVPSITDLVAAAPT